eukprot:3506832-Heterocapsa_arctica.AAC.1
MVRVNIPGLGTDARVLVLESCPRVLSLGRLVEDDHGRFSWVPGRAWITDPQGGEHECVVRNYVPTLAIDASPMA